jgi:hypothetical protein
MTNLNPRHARGNNDLGLFAWAERQYRDGTPYAVRRIASRLGVLPATAATLADAFGIGGEQ